MAVHLTQSKTSDQSQPTRNDYMTLGNPNGFNVDPTSEAAYLTLRLTYTLRSLQCSYVLIRINTSGGLSSWV
ncbi:hypothetical protein BN8_06232 [Fibrisoma limi BUZ 3]|uniref:Uncharacterized protein n=1 Tax=Fibrisoma limi BUZ 3 TaxID=1185876 RepID=I2GSG5_9BACT|nr:hypothetical protein BN8_06232 [Fibrisoma limi BUZ 3]